MIRWLLDTNHLSLQERGHPRVTSKLAEIPPGTVAMSVVSVEEMLRGRLALLARYSSGPPRQHAYRKLMETMRFCNLVPVLLFDEACELKLQELRALRLRVGTQDLRIAATALVHGVPVVTQNFKDFSRIPGLELEDWSA